MRVVDADWEIRNLGVKTAELCLDSPDDINCLTAFLESDAGQQYQYLVVKCPSGISELLFALPSMGFVFIEAQISLQYNVSDDSVHPSVALIEEEWGTRFCLNDITEDERKFEALKSEIELHSRFSTDRIYLDPGFTQDLAARRYSNWCNDLKSQGVRFLDVVLDGISIGFTTYKRKGAHSFETPLGAYYESAGIASMLSPLGSRAFFSRLRGFLWVGSSAREARSGGSST